MILVATCLTLTACGGGSDSGFGESLAEERQANECVSLGAGTIINSCNFDIVVVTFGGSFTPVNVAANGTSIDPDADFNVGIVACRSPFTPVETSATEFECL